VTGWEVVKRWFLISREVTVGGWQVVQGWFVVCGSWYVVQKFLEGAVEHALCGGCGVVVTDI